MSLPQFSSDGKYFAILSDDGKLKIWNAVNGVFEQEYIPDYHLSSPCTCLQFINSQSGNKGSSPKKKRKRDSLDINDSYILLGTTTGALLFYSIAKAKISFVLNSGISEAINCLSRVNGNAVYSGANANILCWDLEKMVLKDKWTCGNEKITAIREIPQSKLLVASKMIKLLDVINKYVLRTYTGHSSEVCLLEYLHSTANSDPYFLSASKSDHILNCWSLSVTNSEKNAIVGFALGAPARHVSIVTDTENVINVAALNRNGEVHIFRHTLNGKCSRPIKPKPSIVMARDKEEQKDALVQPIPIMGVHFQMDLNLLICYGNTIHLIFENVDVKFNEKIQCLVRSDPTIHKSSHTNATSKVRSPFIGDNVQYKQATPFCGTLAPKRKQDGTLEVPMEQRLENLTLTQSDISKVPRAENVAQLLIQGLHSKDKHILKNVLNQKDETIIRNTIKRLPLTVIQPLLEELTSLLQGKTASCYIASLWLKILLGIHAGLLLANPQLHDLLGPILGSIHSRLSLQMPLIKLKGRLNLLMSQMNSSAEENNEDENALLNYVDRESSDSESRNIDIILQKSDSENEWSEEEESEDENERIKETEVLDDADSDSSMSS